MSTTVSVFLHDEHKRLMIKVFKGGNMVWGGIIRHRGEKEKLHGLNPHATLIFTLSGSDV